MEKVPYPFFPMLLGQSQQPSAPLNLLTTSMNLHSHEQNRGLELFGLNVTPQNSHSRSLYSHFFFMISLLAGIAPIAPWSLRYRYSIRASNSPPRRMPPPGCRA